MIKTLIDNLVHTWPTEIETVARALQLATPVLVICLAVWLCAKAGQWLIDRYTMPSPPTMRTADARQIERDVEQLWKRRPGFENTYPTDTPPANPFPQPEPEVRNPAHRRRPAP